MPDPYFRDSWAKHEAWRKHPVFSAQTKLRSIFPGFGIAVVAFTAYVIADNYLLSGAKAEEHPKHH